MRTHLLILIVFLAGAELLTPRPSRADVAASSPTLSGRPITLDQAFEFAKRRSETLAIRAASVDLAMAQMDVMLSALKPKISLLGTYLAQNTPNDSGAQLTALQPIFTGFREYIAYKAAKALGEASRYDLQRAEDLLYQDVALSHITLLGVQKEIAIREGMVRTHRARLDDIRHRMAVGRSRKSEELAAASQLALLEADLESAKGRESVAQELLRFFTGMPDRFLPQDLPVPAAPNALPFLERASYRSDVQSKRKALASADLLTVYARRGRWPTITLQADYYLRRTSRQAAVWDALFNASLPLYTGGQIPALVRQAEAEKRSAEQALSLALRGAETEIRSLFDKLDSALRSMKAFEKAAELARRNSQAQQEDYKLGLVSNQDVLIAFNQWQQAQLQCIQSRYEAIFFRYELEVAAGRPRSFER